MEHEYSKAAFAAMCSIRPQNFNAWLASKGYELPPPDLIDVITGAAKWKETTVVDWLDAHAMGFDIRLLCR